MRARRPEDEAVSGSSADLSPGRLAGAADSAAPGRRGLWCSQLGGTRKA